MYVVSGPFSWSRLPLTANLPQFLPTLRVGTPAIRIDFNIFIGEYCLECPTPMIEIQDIFGEKSISVKIGEKEFINPLIDPLTHCHRLAWRRRRLSGHHHSNVREPLP